MPVNYYAVAKGRQPGVYYSWDACRAQVDRYSGSRFQKFPSASEAAAFVNQNSGSTGQSNGGNGTTSNNARK